ncbi:MAG: DUF2079 domain-containing protein, partial [Candidatus Eremiobacteraeota bacterium]|nr:DUF2079 domain-containing protein [Candidatus Eremiobacteraeota bacterium]
MFKEFKPVAVAAVAFVVVYVALDLNKLYALRYGADLGTFAQTIVNMAHGSSWNYGEWRPHLEVHDSWLLYALAPIMALFPRTETLVAVQVFAVAAAAIPLAFFGREIGLSPRAANVVAIAYLLTPSAQGFSYDNFSENVFVPLIAFSGAVAVRRRSPLGTLVAAQLLMGLKEDEIFFVAWLAAACALFWDRRIGVAALVLAGANGGLYYGIERALGTQSNA